MIGEVDASLVMCVKGSGRVTTYFEVGDRVVLSLSYGNSIVGEIAKIESGEITIDSSTPFKAKQNTVSFSQIVGCRKATFNDFEEGRVCR